MPPARSAVRSAAAAGNGTPRACTAWHCGRILGDIAGGLAPGHPARLRAAVATSRVPYEDRSRAEAFMYWRARRFSRLADLADPDFFKEIEAGLLLIAKNSSYLADSALVLAEQDRARAARVLASHASDEAGKFLMLMDAVRCPRGQLQQHLRRVGQHLPRLLYAETATLCPAPFQELVGYLESDRKSHYLDG
jgi:hypothetical protein